MQQTDSNRYGTDKAAAGICIYSGYEIDGWHRSIQPSTDLERGMQVSRCGVLLDVEGSRRPGNEDPSREENSVTGAGRYAGDGPCGAGGGHSSLARQHCLAPWASRSVAGQVQ